MTIVLETVSTTCPCDRVRTDFNYIGKGCGLHQYVCSRCGDTISIETMLHNNHAESQGISVGNPETGRNSLNRKSMIFLSPALTPEIQIHELLAELTRRLH